MSTAMEYNSKLKEASRNRVVYEWCIETYTDDEFQDIIENNYSDTLSFTASDFQAPDGHATRLMLARREGNEVDGVQDTLWAYAVEQKLPVYFSDSAEQEVSIKVPQKFHKEIETFFKARK